MPENTLPLGQGLLTWGPGESEFVVWNITCMHCLGRGILAFIGCSRFQAPVNSDSWFYSIDHGPGAIASTLRVSLPEVWGMLLYPFYRWGKQGSERLSNSLERFKPRSLTTESNPYPPCHTAFPTTRSQDPTGLCTFGLSRGSLISQKGASLQWEFL